MGTRVVGGLGLLTLLLVLLGAVGTLRGRSAGGPEPGREIPEFRMTAVTTRTQGVLEKRSLLGSPWVANFIFTHCAGPCPRLTAEMASLQRDLPREVRLVTFTVDPDRDTPRVLQDYAGRVGADPERWLFLAGKKGDLYRLLYEGFNLPIVEDRGAPSGFRVTHSTKFVLVDSRGRLRGYYGVEEASALARLRRDAVRLLGERS